MDYHPIKHADTVVERPESEVAYLRACENARESVRITLDSEWFRAVLAHWEASERSLKDALVESADVREADILRGRVKQLREIINVFADIKSRVV